ncbi:uncharacterized protein LOC142776557 [Rhipicephalus microplus]|uniref:uncharacterized protein LOC142776557 n=1 Tax=Rhipicephalus microplus TaxID=6941 RepID=UPI003F6A836C
MEQYLVQDLLEICGAMGISAGSAETKEAILEVMRAENVTADEADEFWELICEQKQKAEECRKRRKHALRMKELDLQIQALKWELAKHQLHNFQTGENIAHFLEDFEVVCCDVGVSRDLWVEKLATLLPRKIAHVLNCLPFEEAGDFSHVRYALIRYFFLSSHADEESRSDEDKAEAPRRALKDDARRKEREDDARSRAMEARRAALQDEESREASDVEARHKVQDTEVRQREPGTEEPHEELGAEAHRKPRDAEAHRKALEMEPLRSANDRDESRTRELDDESRRRALEVDACRQELEQDARHKALQNEAREREHEADFEGQKTRAIDDSDRHPPIEGSVSALVGCKVIGTPVLSQPGTASNRPEGTLANKSGASTPHKEGSTLVGKCVETASIGRSSDRKRRRHKHSAVKTTHAKHAKAAVKCCDVFIRGAGFSSRRRIAKTLCGKCLNLRPSPRLRSGGKSVKKNRVSVKFGRRDHRLVSSFSLPRRGNHVEKHRVRLSSNKGCHSPPWREGHWSNRRGKRRTADALFFNLSGCTKVDATKFGEQVGSSSFCPDRNPRKLWNARLSRVRLRGAPSCHYYE